MLDARSERKKRLDLAELLVGMVRPPPKLSIDAWADEHRILASETSAEPGRWNTSRAEYQRGPMQAMSDPSIHTVVLKTSSQVGKTEILNNVAAYYIDQDPSPILVVQPTVDLGKAWSKDRLSTLLRDTDTLQGKVREARTRDSGNTMLHKTFPGGHITITGANSASGLRMRPIRVVLLDEVSAYPASAGSEGDPVKLAFKRSTTFWNKKHFLCSTPTTKGFCRITMAYDESDQRKFWVPCPHCGELQILMWSGVRWDKNKDGTHKTDTAGYECCGCEVRWTDPERFRAVRAGEWIAEGDSRGVAGFWLNEIYSPWVPLSEMVENFLEAKKSPETLRVFVNTSLGEEWEEDGEQPDDGELYGRREEYAAQVPQGAAVVTIGCDVQGDRLEAESVAWGAGEESWQVEYKEFWGDPEGQEVWARFDEWARKPLEHESGVTLRAAAVCIDSGYLTKTVYAYTKGKSKRRVFAIKGVGTNAHPPVGRVSRGNKQRVPVFPVGTDTLKRTLYSRLKQEEPGPGYMHFPMKATADYFRGITAEKAVTRHRNGFPFREWVKVRERNEPVDCRVYAMAALEILNCNLDKLVRNLARRVVRVEDKAAGEASVEEEKADELTQEQEVPRPRKRRRPRTVGGFTNGWR
jgi:phage terminase large subunit GpA-like protein